MGRDASLRPSPTTGATLCFDGRFIAMPVDARHVHLPPSLAKQGLRAWRVTPSADPSRGRDARGAIWRGYALIKVGGAQ